MENLKKVKNGKISKIVSILIIILMLFTTLNIGVITQVQAATTDFTVNLSDLTYTSEGKTESLKKYTQTDFEQFLSDYNSKNLPQIYVTEFLFDGVSMVKTYDLDDFIESGNNAEVDVLKITAININTPGNIEFTGEIKGGMIAVDTNGRTEDINIILNNAKIDTDSKKTPAIYVYNKDITYTGCNVTIKTVSGSKNYIEGGKLKKVSLVGSDELDNYTSKYSEDNKTNYTNYTKYYGVYTSEQINNILFAKVQADNEDLRDGDPYYFYKASGAISSDIDLYFEGTGYLEVKSKNKEGIETKGNLTLAGGTGDYVVYAEDDCLNTTTTSSANKSARNTLTINVNSLYAIVDGGEDADEGDAIDSNGTLVIDGGTIVAIAHPGQDSGLDSENGIYINSGTVIATGDMYDQISSESKQNFMVLRFANKISNDNLISILNENDNVLMAYKTDRTYTTLVFSSPDLTEGTYYIYKDGNIEGDQTNGYYTNVTNYTKGTKQAYSSSGAQNGGMMGDKNMPNGEMPNMSGNENFKKEGNDMPNKDNLDGERPELPEGVNGTSDENRPEPPNGTSDENRPELPNDNNTDSNTNRPEKPNNSSDTENTDENTNKKEMRKENNFDENMTEKTSENQNSNIATNDKFEVNGISNQFSGVSDYTESQTEQTNNENSSKTELINTIIIIGLLLIIIIIVIVVVIIKKNKKINKN